MGTMHSQTLTNAGLLRPAWHSSVYAHMHAYVYTHVLCHMHVSHVCPVMLLCWDSSAAEGRNEQFRPRRTTWRGCQALHTRHYPKKYEMLLRIGIWKLLKNPMRMMLKNMACQKSTCTRSWLKQVHAHTRLNVDIHEHAYATVHKPDPSYTENETTSLVVCYAKEHGRFCFDDFDDRICLGGYVDCTLGNRGPSIDADADWYACGRTRSKHDFDVRGKCFENISISSMRYRMPMRYRLCKYV